jgi:hypothetical protein
MTTGNVRTAPAVSHEKRTTLVNQLWNGIQETLDLLDRPDQKRELMLDLEKYRRGLTPVSLRALAPDDAAGDVCLE